MIAMRELAARRSASASVSAQIAETATESRGAASLSEGTKRSR